jgi:hypothetical protein
MAALFEFPGERGRGCWCYIVSSPWEGRPSRLGRRVTRACAPPSAGEGAERREAGERGATVPDALGLDVAPVLEARLPSRGTSSRRDVLRGPPSPAKE